MPTMPTRIKQPTLYLVCVLLCAFAIMSAATAQSINSSVEGAVRDSSGAVVQDANVVLINQATGTREATKTNEAGEYLFPSVITGSYSLEATKQGFESYHLTAFTVQVAQRATENIVLNPGSASQTVTVNGDSLAPLLEISSNVLGTIITPRSVAQLPLNGRNFLQLAFLAGATQLGPDLATSQTNRTLPGISVAGMQQDLTMYTVDGMALTGSRLGNSEMNLSIADIDQFKVRQGFFMPGNGTDPAIIDVVTKSGTNRLHGELFEFLRTNQTQARNYFSPTPAGPYHRNQFGFGVGGPIIKDKVFFFANYEGLRQILNAPANGFTPTQAMFGGDFSQVPVKIYDPATFNPTTKQRTAFPNNIIPAARINPVSQKLLQYYLPGSSYASQPSNIFGNPDSYLDDDQYNIRIDYNLSSRNVLFGHVSNDNSPDGQDTLFPLGGSTFPMNTKLAVLQWTNTISNSTVNEARVGWTRGEVFDRGATQEGVQDQLGITGTADANGIPQISPSGFTSFGNATGNIGNIDNVYQLHDEVSHTKGTHTFQSGVDLRYARSIQQSSNGNARGVIDFSNVFTAQLAPNAQNELAPVAGTGNSFADFLLGMPLSAVVGSMPRMHYRYTELEPYFHDSWKLRIGLTLNYGIGWYLGTPPNPSGSADRSYPHAVNLQTGQYLFTALGQLNAQVLDTDLNNWEPRIGLAWQPSYDKNTVVRAGWGMYYGALRLVDQQFSILGPGVSIAQSLANSVFNPQPTYVFGTNVLPPDQVQPITQSLADGITGLVYSDDVKNRTPYVEMWTLSIQRTFGPSNLLELSYLGNQAHRLGSRWNANDCSSPTSLVCNPALIPFKRYEAGILLSSNAGVSAYNALIVKFEHQYSHGLSLLANYTWAKTMSMLGGSSNVYGQRGTDHKADRGLAPYNIPQSLVVSTIWDVPFGRGRQFGNNLNPIFDRVAGGWGIDFISTFSQGNPEEVTAPNTTPGTFSDFRANQLCNGNRSTLANRNPRTNGRYWFNPACFAAPQAGFFGNSNTNIITGPGQNDWDLALHKNIPVKERVNLEFRMEAFNAFNHAQFLQPNNSVASASLGRISTARDGRILQFGLKLLW
jgi:hypothetical protein